MTFKPTSYVFAFFLFFLLSSFFFFLFFFVFFFSLCFLLFSFFFLLFCFATDEYQKVVLESVFTLCPKGQSVEQFRIYEAIESGSIPIIAREGTYAAERLPPEYLSSPMVFVETWEEVVAAMKTLEADLDGLLRRQIDLLRWYHNYMNNKLLELEGLLLAKVAPSAPAQ